MKKFLLMLSICSVMLFSFAFATTIDLSAYDLPDLEVSDSIVSACPNQILTQNNSETAYYYFFTQYPLEISSENNGLYSVNTNNMTHGYVSSGSSWTSAGIDYELDVDENTATTNGAVIYSNYTVYDYEDNSNIIYNPSSNGGENMSTILTDLTTVLTAVLTNATSLVTWISSNPLVYLWVIMAIIIAIISFVRGFIRGV